MRLQYYNILALHGNIRLYRNSTTACIDIFKQEQVHMINNNSELKYTRMNWMRKNGVVSFSFSDQFPECIAGYCYFGNYKTFKIELLPPWFRIQMNNRIFFSLYLTKKMAIRKRIIRFHCRVFWMCTCFVLFVESWSVKRAI